MPGWQEWGNQNPQQQKQQNQWQVPQQAPQQGPKPAAGPPPPPMSLTPGQVSTQPVGQQGPPPTPGQQNQGPVNQWNQAYQQFSGNSDLKDTEQYSPQQWEAWNQQEAKLRGQGGGAQNCPPNLPFTGRNGQCAAKPDDCPDGMHVEGSDTNGSAKCVQNGQGQQAPGMFAGPPMQGGQRQQQNPNALLSDTYAPQLGYFGQLGQMNGSGQGGINMQQFGPIIQSLLGMQLG